MSEDSFYMNGVFFDSDNDDDDSIDGGQGLVSMMDGEILCITSNEGLEVRFLRKELEELLIFYDEQSESYERSED